MPSNTGMPGGMDWLGLNQGLPQENTGGLLGQLGGPQGTLAALFGQGNRPGAFQAQANQHMEGGAPVQPGANQHMEGGAPVQPGDRTNFIGSAPFTNTAMQSLLNLFNPGTNPFTGMMGSAQQQFAQAQGAGEQRLMGDLAARGMAGGGAAMRGMQDVTTQNQQGLLDAFRTLTTAQQGAQGQAIQQLMGLDQYNINRAMQALGIGSGAQDAALRDLMSLLQLGRGGA